MFFFAKHRVCSTTWIISVTNSALARFSKEQTISCNKFSNKNGNFYQEADYGAHTARKVASEKETDHASIQQKKTSNTISLIFILFSFQNCDANSIEKIKNEIWTNERTLNVFIKWKIKKCQDKPYVLFNVKV